MRTETEASAEISAAANGKTGLKVIDCDVHNMLKSGADLVPYLKEPWKSMVARLGLHIPGTYASPIGVMRKDAVPPGGGVPASDPDFLIEQLVKPYDMEYVILTGGMYAVNVHPDPDYAAAVASAYNDYLIAEWLPRHPSFKGAMIVPVQDPQQAAREIDRVGPHPGIVEIMLASASSIPYGNRFFHPIYEAAERNGLPVGIHPGSEGGGTSGPPTAAGYPTNYLQWHTSLSQNFMAHLISLVCEGVFEKFPRLRFVLVEGGVAWLPHLMWRLDKNYKALRWTVPWLKRLPSEYIREHCYLTTQPIEEPNDFEHLKQIFDMIDAERMLLFSSDYPHWDFDDPSRILRRLPERTRKRIFYQNAKELYRL